MFLVLKNPLKNQQNFKIRKEHPDAKVAFGGYFSPLLLIANQCTLASYYKNLQIPCSPFSFRQQLLKKEVAGGEKTLAALKSAEKNIVGNMYRALLFFKF